MTTPTHDTCAAAHDYAARGLSVVPVGRDKKPLCAWKVYQERIATAEEIDGWFQQWPEAGIAIVTGRVSNRLVVDIDASGDAEQFAKARETVDATLPESLLTPIDKTPRGGLHYHFTRTIAMGNRTHVGGLPIDVRCDGGYVLAPPSPGYTWIVSPSDCEVADPPQALLELLAKQPQPQQAPPREQRSQADAVVYRCQQYVDEIPPAVAGANGHTQTLLAATAIFWGFDLGEVDGWPLLVSYSNRCQPPWGERELRHKMAEGQKPEGKTQPCGYLRDAPSPFSTSRSKRPNNKTDNQEQKDTPPPKEHGGGSYVENPIDTVLAGCATLRRICETAGTATADGGRHGLNSEQRFALSSILCSLPGGRKKIHEVMGKCVDYDRAAVDALIDSIQYHPITCKALHAQKVCRERGICDALKERGGKSPVVFAYVAKNEPLVDFTVDHVCIYDSNPPVVELTISGVVLKVSMATLIVGKKFRLAYAETLRRVPMMPHTDREADVWAAVVNKWLESAETVEQPPEASKDIMQREQLRGLIESLPIGEDIIDLDAGKALKTEDGQLVVKAIPLLKPVRDLVGDIESADLCAHLRNLGFVSKTVRLPADKEKPVRAWVACGRSSGRQP